MPYHHKWHNSDPVELRYGINVIPYVAVQHYFDFASGMRINTAKDWTGLMPYRHIWYNINPVEWRYGINVMLYSYLVDQVYCPTASVRDSCITGG
jgi:hypothetical protein